jgi:hypothetical protein
MLVDGAEAGLGQFLGDTGTQDSGAVQAEDGIHGGIIDEMGNELIGAVLGFTQTGLIIGDVDIIVDVRVIGGEVATGDPQGDIAAADRQVHKFDHWEVPPIFSFSSKKRKTFLSPGEAFLPGL